MRTFLEILSEVAGAALSEAESAAAETDEDKYRRLSVAARAAVMAADSAAPLVLEPDAHCTVLVLDTMTDAVRAIALAHQQLPPAPDGSSRTPLPPLLPYVHAMWPFYVSAVAAGNAVASRRALDQLPLMAAACGGDFLRQRFAEELWPRLRPLVLHGAPHTGLLVDAAPGTVERTQLAALTCLYRLASCEAARDTVADVAADAAEALAAVLRAARSRDPYTHAERALHALGALDADAVWLTLLKLGLAQLPPRPDTALLLACC